MDTVEPHWIALLWFAVFATLCGLVFLTVAGMLPLRERPEAARSHAATLLVIGNGLLLSLLSTGTGLYGFAELRWSSLIVVAGLVVLFAPGLFEAWPSSRRDGPGGLALLIAAQMIALATLARVAGTFSTVMS